MPSPSTPGQPRHRTHATCRVDGCHRPNDSRGLCSTDLNHARVLGLLAASWPSEPAHYVELVEKWTARAQAQAAGKVRGPGIRQDLTGEAPASASANLPPNAGAPWAPDAGYAPKPADPLASTIAPPSASSEDAPRAGDSVATPSPHAGWCPTRGSEEAACTCGARRLADTPGWGGAPGPRKGREADELASLRAKVAEDASIDRVVGTIEKLRSQAASMKQSVWEALGEPTDRITWPLMVDGIAALRHRALAADQDARELTERRVSPLPLLVAGEAVVDTRYMERDREIVRALLDGIEGECSADGALTPSVRAALTVLRVLSGIREVAS